MVQPSQSQVNQLPKVDLHSHIDGSVPIRELLRISRLRGRKLLTSRGAEITTASGLVAHLKGSGYETMLDDIVNRFFPITNLMQTEEVLRDIGVAYAKEMSRQNVIYAEGRFAPQYHLREGLSIDEAIQSMQEGLAEGSDRFGVKLNLIVAIGRESEGRLGDELARSAARNKGVVALDLGGPEAGNPPEKFERAFAIATAAGLKKTVHAGEGAGSREQNLANVRTAIERLGADRVGHAIDLAGDEGLIALVAARHVTVEACPVSNSVLGKIRSPRDLGIGRLLDRGVALTVNSDDPALWPHGSITDVLAAVCRSYRFGFETVDRLTSNAIEGAFIGPSEKRTLQDRYRSARDRIA